MATAIDHERGSFRDEEEEIVNNIFGRLAARFSDEEIKERVEADGTTFAYVEAPSIRRRLNQVLGYDRWEHKIQIVGQSAVCQLTIYLPTGRALTRTGVGHVGPSTKDEIIYKGAATDAFKRACVEFGVAEYLYTGEPVPAPSLARGGDRRDDRDRDRDDDRSNGHKERRDYQGGYKPQGDRGGNGRGGERNGEARVRDSNGRENWRKGGNKPTTGTALIAWVRSEERDKGNQAADGLEKYLNKWAKDNSLGYPWSNWSRGDVLDAYEEGQRYIHGDDDR